MQRGIVVVGMRGFDGQVIEEVFGPLYVEGLPPTDARVNRSPEDTVDDGSVDARPGLTLGMGIKVN